MNESNAHSECLNQKYQPNERKWKFICFTWFPAIFHFLFRFAVEAVHVPTSHNNNNTTRKRRRRRSAHANWKTGIDYMHTNNNIRSDIDADPSMQIRHCKGQVQVATNQHKIEKCYHIVWLLAVARCYRSRLSVHLIWKFSFAFAASELKHAIYFRRVQMSPSQLFI